ncbi:MAG: hypothetical protein P4L40_10340 [Terracidiphilus sp.]|nr:hypothetical protein [Terracidiphilus sp.]
MSRRLPVLILLLAMAPFPMPLSAQTSAGAPSSATAKHSPSSTTAKPTTPAAAPAASEQDNSQNASQPPQIIVNPPAAPTPEWGWREQATWASGIVLAVLAYVGIMLALRALKRIERHLETTATTAQAALDSSSAALSLAQAIAHSERPWIVVTVEPFLTMESSFKVMAANRGRSPARIITAISQVYVARDEKQLPVEPEFEPATGDPPEPIVLLPGEATGIWAFNRDDLATICKSADALRKVERWQETLFLYGRITYMDLNAVDGAQSHETSWCCRYIHGEKNSALVMAGPPPYNRHS